MAPEIADPRVQRHGVLFGSHRRQEPLCLSPAVAAGQSRRRELNVLHNGHFFGQLGMLEGDRHAGAMQLPGVRTLDLLSGNTKDREIGPHGAGGNADERRFSRPVLAHDGVHLAPPDAEADGLQGLHRAVIFGRRYNPHDRGAHQIPFAGGHSMISSRFFSRM